MRHISIILLCAAVTAAQTVFAQELQWERVPQLDTAIVVRSIVIHGENLFIATNDYGVYRSSDYGNSWLLKTPKNNLTIAALTSFDEYLFAGTDPKKSGDSQRTYRSSNFGETWEFSAFGGAICFGRIGRCVLSGNTYNAINRTCNKGKTWLGSDAFTNVVAFYTMDSLVFAYSLKWGMIRTADSGATWGIPYVFKDPVNTFYNSNGTILLGATNEGVYRTTNGGKGWSEYNIGMIGTVSVAVYTFQLAGNILYAGTSEGLYHSTNNGAFWQKTNDTGLNGIIIKHLISHGQYLFAGTETGLYRAKLPAVDVEEQQPVPSGLTISPNPASESFTVQCAEAATLNVRDIFGRSVFTTTFNSKVVVPTREMYSGVYSVEVIGADYNRSITKVVVNK